MDFLKAILGDELFAQVVEKINAHNGAEENKENQIKIGNLGSGQYVSKEKYASKESELASKIQELVEANNLIADMKKASKNDEALQGKIGEYESQVVALQKQLEQTKVKAALKVALLGEKALDVDYLTFKLNEKMNESGEHLELDENENIKGWKDKIEGLKIQFPTQFETANTRKIEEHKLDKPDDSGNGVLTRSDILKLPYQERQAYAESHSEAYAQAMGR